MPNSRDAILLTGVTKEGTTLELILIHTPQERLEIRKGGRPVGLSYDKSCLKDVTDLFWSLCIQDKQILQPA